MAGDDDDRDDHDDEIVLLQPQGDIPLPHLPD